MQKYTLRHKDLCASAPVRRSIRSEKPPFLTKPIQGAFVSASGFCFYLIDRAPEYRRPPNEANKLMGKHLDSDQRKSLERMYSYGFDQKTIARVLRVHPSTICRELKRNSLKGGVYVARLAQAFYRARRHLTYGGRGHSSAYRYLAYGAYGWRDYNFDRLEVAWSSDYKDWRGFYERNGRRWTLLSEPPRRPSLYSMGDKPIQPDDHIPYFLLLRDKMRYELEQTSPGPKIVKLFSDGIEGVTDAKIVEIFDKKTVSDLCRKTG